MGVRDKKQAAIKRSKGLKPGKRTLLIACLVLILTVGLGAWYYLAHKTPFVYQPDASKAQIEQLSALANQGKTCKDIVGYIDKELAQENNRSIKYDLMVEKADCQNNYNKDAALQTYASAYKLADVSNPVVGLVLAEHDLKIKNYKSATKIYKQLQAYYQNDNKDSSSIKNYQLKFISGQLKTIESKQ